MRLPFFLNYNICHGKTCHRDAQYIFSSMNSSVDPCENFYEFSCGGWIAKTTKPKYEATWTHWEIANLKVEKHIQQMLEDTQRENELGVIKIAKKLYNTCINYDRTETNNLLELLKLMADFGGWPIIESNWTNNELWLTEVTKINSRLAIQPLINFHVSINLYNTSEYILYIDHPNFIFPEWILSHPSIYGTQLKAYTQWIMNTVLEIAKMNQISIDYADIKHQIHEIVKFEIQVASLINLKDDRNITNLYKKMTINQLQLWTDLISTTSSKNVIWSYEMDNLLSIYNITIDDGKYIIIKDIIYILELIKLIEKTPPRIVANYLGWSIVHYFSKDVSKNLQTFSFLIDKLLLGIDDHFSRNHQCVIAVKKQMNLAISYEYINKYITDHTKNNIEIMMENIKSVLKTTLNSFIWLDERTKMHAIEKADAITYLIANPNYLKNATFIENYFQELKITDNIIKNIINWNHFTRKNEFMQLKKSLKIEKWYNTITDVNSYYSVLENSIIVPAGLIQYPFYASKRLQALNYGAIGTILSHEFSHAFDNTGRQADKNGNIKQWWSSTSLAKYTESLKCFQQHFNKYIIKMLDSSVKKKLKTEINFKNTQDEVIADVIGIKLAYEAYNAIKENEIKITLPQLEKYSTDQLFFIAFASQWCELSNTEQLLMEIMDGDHIPNKIRVLGVLSNSEEFNKAFNCKLNSPMNPINKCKLW